MSLEYKHGLLEREEAERKFIEAYRMGTISDEELIREYPKYQGIIKAKDEKFERILQRQEAMMDNFRSEINNIIQRRLKDNRSSSEPPLQNKFLFKALQILVANQSTLLEYPFFNLLPTGYIAADLIPIDAFAKKFKLSTTTKLSIKFILILVITNYLFAFKSALEVSKEIIPNLLVIAKALPENLMNIVSTGGILQFNNIKALGIGEKAVLTGKILKEFNKLSIKAIGNALALALVQNSITNQETDVKDIIDSTDDETGFASYVKRVYRKIRGDIREPKKIEDEVFKSPTSLFTNDQLKRVNQTMLEIEPIIQDLTIVDETSLFNPLSWNKAIGAIKRIPKSLEDIKSQKFGTQVEQQIKNVLFNINPEISKNIDMETLSITAEDINNQIESTCNKLTSQGKYAFHRAAETYNYYSIGGMLPGINIGKADPVNVLKKTEEINVDILLGGLGLLYVFTLIYYVHSGFNKAYRYWKPAREETDIEVMPDQRIRKSKSKRSKRKY